MGRPFGVQPQHHRAARRSPDCPSSHRGIEAAVVVRRHQHRRNSQFHLDAEGEGSERGGQRSSRDLGGGLHSGPHRSGGMHERLDVGLVEVQRLEQGAVDERGPVAGRPVPGPEEAGPASDHAVGRPSPQPADSGMVGSGQRRCHRVQEQSAGHLLHRIGQGHRPVGGHEARQTPGNRRLPGDRVHRPMVRSLFRHRRKRGEREVGRARFSGPPAAGS